MNPSFATPISRIEVADALRGFAVLAILLVHSLEHFIFPVYPDPAMQPGWLNTLDQGVLSIVFSLFAGKSYAIFALLFGFTFAVQFHNEQVKGNDFGYRFLWRMVLLTFFATLNAAFFPAGDVLLLFSIVGIVLFIVRKWSNRAVLIFAVLMLLQPVEWFHYVAGLINPDHTLPDFGVGAMYGEVAEYTRQGNWREFFVGNVTLGQKASLMWAVEAGRYMQTAGLFILGMLIGREGLLEVSEKNNRFWIVTLIVSAVSFGPLYQLKVEIFGPESASLVKQTVGVAFDMWQKFAFTCILLSGFVLLYQRIGFRKVMSPLRFYGRMSLTNYITQSVFGALIYFPIGLNLARYCGYTLSLGVGIIIFGIQFALSRWWLKTHKQGPLEMLWHKLTWAGKNN